jgi:hypothetical protein
VGEVGDAWPLSVGSLDGTITGDFEPGNNWPLRWESFVGWVAFVVAGVVGVAITFDLLPACRLVDFELGDSLVSNRCCLPAAEPFCVTVSGCDMAWLAPKNQPGKTLPPARS